MFPDMLEDLDEEMSVQLSRNCLEHFNDSVELLEYFFRGVGMGEQPYDFEEKDGGRDEAV